MTSLYGYSILNLLAVLTFIFVLMYVLKKLKLAKYAQNRHIRIINSVPIGGKEKILLLEVNNTFLLLGATPNHIETLYVFDELKETQTVTANGGNEIREPTFSALGG